MNDADDEDCSDPDEKTEASMANIRTVISTGSFVMFASEYLPTHVHSPTCSDGCRNVDHHLNRQVAVMPHRYGTT